MACRVNKATAALSAMILAASFMHRVEGFFFPALDSAALLRVQPRQTRTFTDDLTLLAKTEQGMQ